MKTLNEYNNSMYPCSSWIYYFKNFYGLVIMDCGNAGGFYDKYKLALCNGETHQYSLLNNNLQLLLRPFILNELSVDYFLEYKSKEYIQIQLGINMIKSLYNII